MMSQYRGDSPERGRGWAAPEHYLGRPESPSRPAVRVPDCPPRYCKAAAEQAVRQKGPEFGLIAFPQLQVYYSKYSRTLAIWVIFSQIQYIHNTTYIFVSAHKL